VLGKEPWPRKKIFVSPVPSVTVGKGFADGFIACAERFRRSANPRFPVVISSVQTYLSVQTSHPGHMMLIKGAHREVGGEICKSVTGAGS
jgi:hypothetical protein